MGKIASTNSDLTIINLLHSRATRGIRLIEDNGYSRSVYDVGAYLRWDVSTNAVASSSRDISVFTRVVSLINGGISGDSVGVLYLGLLYGVSASFSTTCGGCLRGFLLR